MTASRQPWTATVMTLFPDMFPGPLGLSVPGRGLDAEVWRLRTVNIRDFGLPPHGSVDDAPFGGGPGMVMRADVLDQALEAVAGHAGPVICPGPRGEPFCQKLAQELAAGPGMVLLCGRYEGIDQRLLDSRSIREISLGDFVLSGGEPAALAIVDATVRLLPGVLGRRESLDEESFADGLLEYPHYTRPAQWKGLAVPEVLLSGDHGRIASWRHAQAEQATRKRRPDLWARYLENMRNSPSAGRDADAEKALRCAGPQTMDERKHP